MLIHFSPEFQAYTNNLPTLEVSGDTVGECIANALNVYPQLYVYLLDNQGDNARKSIFKLNDEFIYDHEHCSIEVSQDDNLYLSHDIPAGEGGALKYIAGALMIVVGALLFWAGPAGGMIAAAGVGMMIGGAISLVATGLMDAFGPTLKSPDLGSGGLDNSPAYTFNGIHNTTASGTPVALVYGEFRVGGQVLSVYTDDYPLTVSTADGVSIQANKEDLYFLAGLSEGPIESVSDIQINQLPITFYQAVDPPIIRLGESNPTTIPNFDRVEDTTSISKKVMAVTDATFKNQIGNEWLPATPVYGYSDAYTDYLNSPPYDPTAGGGG